MEDSMEKRLEMCKKFRDETLIPEKNVIKSKIKELEDEKSDYERLMERCSSLQVNSDSTGAVKIPLDLGKGYSADFEVFDRDFVLVAVGFGFYCQMTWTEAATFCNSRIRLLDLKEGRLNEKVAKINKDLKVFNELINQLT